MSTPLTNIDFYKADHRSQYPDGTGLVFSNWTARKARDPETTDLILFGLQYYIMEYLIKDWENNFFSRPRDEVVDRYRRRMTNAGINISYEHIEDLHDLGYLPLEIRALPEGSRVPIGVASVIVWNTHPEFFWLTNMIETSMSAVLWMPCNSATIADRYRTILEHAAVVSGGDLGFVDFQGHDFSFRGMAGIEAAQMSGAGHLLSFTGTDTVAAIDFLEDFYGADSDKEFVGGSIPATEHSVMCMGSKEGEIETFRRLITQTYPSGPISVVSDTWDYWKVWTEYLPQLRDEILARDGTLVIRPDSGDPVKILAGDPEAEAGTPEFRGSFELAWELFGGTINDKGYKVLDDHINIIYGDAITLERAHQITNNLIRKGFVPKMVLGIGSYTYQYNTRDTLGFAMKATYGEINGEPREIFKDPATDDGTKKSARGLIAVYETEGLPSDPGDFYQVDQVTWAEVDDCAFQPVFRNGSLMNEQTLGEIRDRLRRTT